jgi:hypothetical protein
MKAFDEVALFKGENSRKALAKLLSSRIKSGWEGLSDKRDEIARWRMLYEGPPVPTMDENGQGGGNFDVFVPETRSIIDTMAARLTEVILSPIPLLEMQVEEEGRWADGVAIAQGLDYQLRAQVGIRSVLDTAVSIALVDGLVVLRPTWETRKELVRSYLPVDEGVITDFAEAGISLSEEVITAGVAAIDSEETVVDSPKVDVLPIDEITVYPHNVKSLDDAQLVGHVQRMTPPDLWAAVEAGNADADAVRFLLDNARAKNLGDTEGDELEQDALDYASLGNTPEVANDPDAKVYPIWEVLCRVPVDVRATGTEDTEGYPVAKEGTPYRLCLFRVEVETQTLLYARIFDIPLPSGQYWYTAFTPFPRVGAWTGYSAAQIMEQPQAVLNDVYNQNLQAGQLDLLRIFRKSSGSKLDIEDEPLVQGTVVVAEPGEFEQIQVGGSRQGAFIDEEHAARMMQKITGISEYVMGQTGNSERTLGEIRTVVAEGNEKFKIIVGRLGDAVARVAAHILALDRKHLDTTVTYNSTVYGDAKGATAHLRAEDLMLKGRLRVVGTPELADRRLQVAEAEKVVMFAAQNPLIAPFKSRMWEVGRRFLMAMGITDVTSILGTKEDALAADEAAANQPPPPPEPPALSGRMDETTTLAEILRTEYPDAPFEERFDKALQLRQQAIVIEAAVAATTGMNQQQEGSTPPGKSKSSSSSSKGGAK